MKKIAAFLMGCILLVFTLSAQTVNFTSSNLPIVVINTSGQDILDEPKITADMGIIYNGPGLRNNLTDSFNHYNGKVGIETRGHSSQMFPMKAYGFELRDIAGKSVNKSLFGMPKESDWILYAPYTDKTLMRNFIAYTLSQQLGHWAAHCQFVEVVLNGDYVGVYVFMEKIKRNAGRVNITKLDSTMTNGDPATGGYIFSLDKEPDAWYSSYASPNTLHSYPRFSYVTPKLVDIVQPQKDYIKSYIDSFEFALAKLKFQDTVNGYRKFMDVHSFMDYFFVNEASRNVDGYRLSSFFYKDRDSKNSKIVAGPVWDYDLAFRNANYCNGSDISGWAYNFNYSCPSDGAGLVPFWWERLMADTAYTAELRCRWKALRQTVFSMANINNMIDSIATLVDEAQQRHFLRWPVLGQYVWPNPNPIPGTYGSEITTLKNWISQRLDWMDLGMPDNGPCADFISLVSNVGLSLAVNPNPFFADLKLEVQSKQAQTLYVDVFDMMGRNISARKYQLETGANTVLVPAAGWSNGQYVIRVIGSLGDKIVKNIMKQ